MQGKQDARYKSYPVQSVYIWALLIIIVSDPKGMTERIWDWPDKPCIQ